MAAHGHSQVTDAVKLERHTLWEVNLLLFNYATKSTGGYADFDYFRVTDKLTGTDAPEATDHAASLSGTEEVSGVINSEATVKVTMDALTGEGHTDLKASLSIPSGMDVKDVTFNSDAITGETSWNFKNGSSCIHRQQEKTLLLKQQINYLQP